MDSINYYNKYADDFFENTIDVDLTEIYEKFFKYLPQQAHILDAGCGSGRDSKYFLNKGYKVTAFDASIEMVKKAKEVTKLDVKQMYFQDIEYKNVFDAVWTCSSLLHVPKSSINIVFEKFIASLKVKGLWYMSFKYGKEERVKDARLFNDYTEESIKALVSSYNELEILEIWLTIDRRPYRDDKWLNLIVSKQHN